MAVKARVADAGHGYVGFYVCCVRFLFCFDLIVPKIIILLNTIRVEAI